MYSLLFIGQIAFIGLLYKFTFLLRNILTDIPLKRNRILENYVKSPQEVSIMQYAERIRNLREDSDLNQTTVAKAIHVAQTTYSDYEKGKVRIPLECLIELAKFYNVDMNYIAGVSDKKNEFPKK